MNQAAQNVGDLYNNPVIGLEKLEEGFDQLMSAVNTANETMANSTTKAREVSDRLSQMTKELEPVAAGSRQARDEANATKQAIKNDPDAFTLKDNKDSDTTAGAGAQENAKLENQGDNKNA